MTSLTSTNVFTISCLSIEPPPHPTPAPVNLVLQHWCKALQSLCCTIRTIRCLFADYSYYSSPIRGLFVLFVDYSRTIRTIRRLFADYSYYSSTIRAIRTIRFTILVLSITINLIILSTFWTIQDSKSFSCFNYFEELNDFQQFSRHFSWTTLLYINIIIVI
jgi:hypothetical protein